MKTRPTLLLALAAFCMLILTAASGGGASVGAGPQTWHAQLPLVSRIYPGICTLAPVPVWPTGGRTIDTLVPEFSFSPYTPLAYYKDMYLQYSESPSFSTKVEIKIPSTHKSPLAFVPFDNLLPGRTYYWRLQEDCGSYRASPWSQTASFKTPSGGGTLPGQVTLQKPADDSTGLGPVIRFEWAAVPGATAYEVTIARQGSTVVLYYSTLFCALGGFRADTPYAWWVTARNGYAYGPESARWSFQTGSYATAEAEMVDASMSIQSLTEDGIGVNETLR